MTVLVSPPVLNRDVTILARGAALSLHSKSLAAALALAGSNAVLVDADGPEGSVSRAMETARCLITLDILPVRAGPGHPEPRVRLYTCAANAPSARMIREHHAAGGPPALCERISPELANLEKVSPILFPPLRLANPDPMNPFTAAPHIGLGVCSPPVSQDWCRRVQTWYISAPRRKFSAQCFLGSGDQGEISTRLGSVRIWLAPSPDARGRSAPGLELLTLAANGAHVAGVGIPRDLPGIVVLEHLDDAAALAEGSAPLPATVWKEHMWRRCAEICLQDIARHIR